MRSIAITGEVGPLAARLRAGLDDGDADVRDDPAGCDAVVHIGGERPVTLKSGLKSGLKSLVHVSSATVYGAWPDNPVPLTEQATLRPNPGVDDAIRSAETERVIADWADEHPEVRTTVLRAVTVLGVNSWQSQVLTDPPRLRPGGSDPPRQFVHVDDLLAAVRLALAEGLDGVFNVGADGSISGEAVRGLSARRVSLAAPRRLVVATAAWGWSAVPSALFPLLENPWVVANDKLRAAGWVPRYTNEEAVVAGRPGSRWQEMSSSRRQRVTLGAAAVGVVVGTAAVAAAVVRVRRSRSVGAAGWR